MLYESVANLKVEGSWGKMVTKGKVVSAGTAPEAHGKICGSETSNGIHCCIQAGTAPHVMNYVDNLLVPRTPLPMGLHCQNPLMCGVKLPKEPLATFTDVTLSMPPGDTPNFGDPTNLTALQMQGAKSKCCCLGQ